MLAHRLTHYALLLTATAVLTLPNLGSHSLWDVDEGVNAEAAREMLESGTLITPQFNFEMRTAKPVLLYWLQMGSYSVFGVNEFAARLPSVLAAVLTVLLVYELARRMFGSATGLLAGLILASALEFCMLAHAATPDSTLLLFTVLTLYLFWIASRNNGRSWFAPAGAAAGLAVLTKGPVGLVLPGTIIFLFLLWNHELKRLLDSRLYWGILAFLAVAAPWYILVTAETHGAWIKAFIGRENLGRFTQPMESHRGPIYYQLVGIIVLFAPWSIFLGTTAWHAFKEARRSNGTSESRAASRFLVCWVATYLVFFSIAATKLPNYVLPAYPALAILTARFLQQWHTGKFVVPRWLGYTAIVGLGLVGVVVAGGIGVASGWIPVHGVKMPTFPTIGPWLTLGLIPISGAAIAWWSMHRGYAGRVVPIVAVTSIAFTASIAAFPITALDDYKAPRQLVADAGVNDTRRDLRLATFEWFQPSVVFYSRREVEKLQTWEQAADRLAMPAPVYVFVPAPVWKAIRAQRPESPEYRTAARHFDLYSNCEILVLTNQ
jgi:4-amino-4-deoxy-L-arabinose transferase-like glycosyltransferase